MRGSTPRDRYRPGGELNHDRSNWWAPNISALTGLIGAAGFSDVEILSGEPVNDPRPGDTCHHYRAIIRRLSRYDHPAK